MKIRWFYLIFGAALSSAFVMFTFIVRTDVLRQFDFNTTVKIQDRLPQKAYEYLHLISIPAGFEILTLILVVVLAVSRNWIRLGVAFAVYGAAHVFELIGKMILSQPPPQFMFYKLQTSAWFPDNYQPEGNSFPSGHSLRASFFAALMIVVVMSSYRRRNVIIGGVLIPFVLLGFAVGVALAKVALGQHWATDVVAGSLLGTGAALVASAIEITARDRLNSKNKSDKQVSADL